MEKPIKSISKSHGNNKIKKKMIKKNKLRIKKLRNIEDEQLDLLIDHSNKIVKRKKMKT